MKNFVLTHKPLFVAGALALTLLAAIGLALFQPWKLWVDETADEAAPIGPAAVAGTPSQARQSGPKELFSTDKWQSVSHGTTTGKVKVYQKADGSHVVRLEGLNTSNGPDLRVVLSKGDYKDQGNLSPQWLDLGRLKGNKGSSNYAVPAGTDLSQYKSAVVWCKRFDAVFAAAPITA